MAHIWAKARHWRHRGKEGGGGGGEGGVGEVRGGEEEEEDARAMWLMLVNSIQPCPGIAAGSAQRRRYQAPGPHTDRDKR